MGRRRIDEVVAGVASEYKKMGFKSLKSLVGHPVRFSREYEGIRYSFEVEAQAAPTDVLRVCVLGGRVRWWTFLLSTGHAEYFAIGEDDGIVAEGADAAF